MSVNLRAFAPSAAVTRAARGFAIHILGQGAGLAAEAFSTVLTVLSVGVLTALFPSVSTASTRVFAAAYEFSELRPLAGTFSSARAINNTGKVAGFSSFAGGGYLEHAVIWDNGVPIGLSTPPAGFSAANAINDAGQIAGSSSPSLPNTRIAHEASLWRGANRVGLGPSGQSGVANAVNDAGQVAGSSGTPGNRGYHATVWNDSSAVGLVTLPGWSFSSAQAINKSGQVAGYSTLPAGAEPSTPAPYRATLWNGVAPIDLGTLGGPYSFANAINDSGQVAGWADLAYPARYHATLWNGLKAIDLGTLGGANSAANAISDASQVVGWAEDTHNIQHAVLWNGTVAHDLNSFLGADAVNAGWVLLAANGINDHGWIVGDATNRLTGQFRGFLLVPVPEPETCALFLAGLVLMAGMLLHRGLVRTKEVKRQGDNLPYFF